MYVTSWVMGRRLRPSLITGMTSALMSHLTPKVVTSAGFNLQGNVADIVSNGAWTHDGVLHKFSIPDAWNTVREHGEEVDWFHHLVWSKYGIPRHAAHLCGGGFDGRRWLVMVGGFDGRRWLVMVGEEDKGWLLPLSVRNNVTSIVGRLIVAATSYYVWQERNNRIHDKGERKTEHVTSIIVDIIQMEADEALA
ncbi:hypothetical protein Tco_0706026 [Tanacetum coccineum]|uniref:Uncharacterized protein n=1 Tax=Tanacetum coccineum TaxID=301880 RepID=A0ABQ4Y6D4_9ASTR